MARHVLPLRLVHFSAERIIANVPASAPWELGAFRMLAESRSADGPVGGDFYAFQLRGPKRLTVVIGDACGRGGEGASLLPSVLPQLEELSRFKARPSRLLERLNRRLARSLPDDRFVTSAAFELDAQAGTLIVANAGHVPAMLRSPRGYVAVIGQASGPPLGILDDSSYIDECYPIAKGDVLVFMTDGVLEAVETDLTKMPTLTTLVAQAPAGGRGVHRSLLARLDGYEAPQRADDMTLLSLEILGDADSPSFEHLEQAI
jgi:serine phosphatase RsbU (regulator of sigma subunit)